MSKGVRRILVREGQCPLAARGEENLENLATKWCILKYIWINMWSAQRRSLILLSPAPPFRKLVFFACFRFLFFHPFLQGVSWPHLPLCADAHAHDGLSGAVCVSCDRVFRRRCFTSGSTRSSSRTRRRRFWSVRWLTLAETRSVPRTPRWASPAPRATRHDPIVLSVFTV